MNQLTDALSALYVEWLGATKRFDCLASRTEYVRWISSEAPNMPTCCEKCNQREDVLGGVLMHNGTCEECTTDDL